MQWIGKALTSVNQYYKEINPATLTGAIDVIVISQSNPVKDANSSEPADGPYLSCSPFHVRFGKLSVLRPIDSKVTVKVNGEEIPYPMKVGETGEAFFVFETLEDVPEELKTSPLPSPVQSATSAEDDPQFLSLGESSTGSVLHPNNEQNDHNNDQSQQPRPTTPPPKKPSSSPSSPSKSPKTNSSPRKTRTKKQPKRPPSPGSDTGSLMLDMDGYITSQAHEHEYTDHTTDDELDHFSPNGNFDPSPPAYVSNLSRQMDGGLQDPPSFDSDLSKQNATDSTRTPSLIHDTISRDTSEPASERFNHDRYNNVNVNVGINDVDVDVDALTSGEPRSLPELHSKAVNDNNNNHQARLPPHIHGSQDDTILAARSHAHPHEQEQQILPEDFERSLEQFKKDVDFHAPLPPREQPRTTATNSDQKSSSTRSHVKTLRLTSHQLKKLNLKPGPNHVSFSVTSSYSGVAKCEARIWLLDSDAQIVISDIDGTITKSDALGHVLTMIGRDWTHLGVAKLYSDIAKNGYQILYLTSRAVGQANITREYLWGINQGGYKLPDGPVIMSPDRVMASLHREVIMRKPEVFKMACLRDIQRLFGDQKAPFYAGFGNRITDALSYRSVNIPASRIFTIDSYGDVRVELLHLAGHKSSYIAMNDLVDMTFPPISKHAEPEYSDFEYWRTPPPTLSDADLPPELSSPSSPASPALSARSDLSSRLSMFRVSSFKLGRRASNQSFDQSASSPGTSPPHPTEQQRTHVRSQSDLGQRPSSPLIQPVEFDEPDELDDESGDEQQKYSSRHNRHLSYPYYDSTNNNNNNNNNSNKASASSSALPSTINNRGDGDQEDYDNSFVYQYNTDNSSQRQGQQNDNDEDNDEDEDDEFLGEMDFTSVPVGLVSSE